MGAFERFLDAYSISSRYASASEWPPTGPSGLAELMSEHGGSTFDQGLYRLHTFESAQRANDAVIEAFPELAAGIACFGFDWLGRQFGIDIRTNRSEILLVEPGTGEILEIPVTLADFHNQELVDEPEAALAKSFFAKWRRANPTLLPLAHDVCVGYKIPLFLGGADELENLEPVDLWVYWSICGRLHQQVMGLDPGTKVASIKVD